MSTTKPSPLSPAERADLLVRVQSHIGAADFVRYTSILRKESAATLEKLLRVSPDVARDVLAKTATARETSEREKALAGLTRGQTPDTFAGALASKVNVMLWGPPGRGKSHLAAELARIYAANTGGIVQQVICPEDTPVSVLAGSFQPSGEGGAWAWVDGPVTRVLRNAKGGVLILDELAHLSPESCTWLLGVFDDTRSLTLPSGETITKGPIFAVSTQNDTPAALLPALGDRFPIRAHVTMPAAWGWLGNLAPLAERDLTTDTGASLRPWGALRKMIDAGVPLADSIALLWPDSPAQVAAITLALDV